MLFEAAMFGLTAVNGIMAGAAARANARAQNIINEANVYGRNLVRGANNELASKRGSLRRYEQSVNNQRVLDSAGKASEAHLINYRRVRDSSIKDNLETQVSMAEQAGAQAAAAGRSGLTGGVADLVATTVALRHERIKQRTAEAEKQVDFDASRRNQAIMQAGYDSMDNSEIVDALDYNNEVAVRQRYQGNTLQEAFSGQSAANVRGAWQSATSWI